MQTLAFVLGLGAGFEEVQAVPSEQVLALASDKCLEQVKALASGQVLVLALVVNPNPYGIG